MKFCAQHIAGTDYCHIVQNLVDTQYVFTGNSRVAELMINWDIITLEGKYDDLI